LPVTRTSSPISSTRRTRRASIQRVEQKFPRAAFALLEVIRPAHGADAHYAVGQRNHPHPAMLEAVDADVARVLARAPRGAAEVGKDGRALMLVVLAAQFPFRGKERIAAAGVNHVTR
jgi:hypothetical protein